MSQEMAIPIEKAVSITVSQFDAIPFDVIEEISILVCFPYRLRIAAKWYHKEEYDEKRLHLLIFSTAKIFLEDAKGRRSKYFFLLPRLVVVWV